MKIIGLTSDTHIPTKCKELPPQVLSVFSSVDLILHAGDVVLPETLQQLEKLAPVIAVAGNHDRKKNRFPQPLPNQEIVYLEGYSIGLVHGDSISGSHPYIWERAYRAFVRNPVDIIIFGHTHNPMVITDGRTLLINPGSLGYSRYFVQCSFAKLVLDQDSIGVELFFFEPGNEKISFSYTVNFQPGKLPLTVNENRKPYW